MATKTTYAPGLLGTSLSILLSISVGCASPGVGPIDDGDGDGDGDGGDEPGEDTDPPTDPPDGEEPMDPTGTYLIESRFDIVGGMPGGVGDVLNTFIDMTDDPYDPATWLLDKVEDEIDSGFFRNLISAARPVLDGLVYDLLIQNAPDAVERLMALGEAFGQVAQRFGTESRLEVVRVGDALGASHTMTGYRFVIDGVDHAFDVAELGSEATAVTGVGFAYDEEHVSLAEHSVPLRYGGFLALALDEVIIPMIDPAATNLEELLAGVIDCAAVGAELADRIGVGSPGLFEGACELGLGAGSDFVMDKLVSIDEAAQVTLVISGAARAADQSGDRMLDTLTAGKWNGAIDYAGNRGGMAEDVSTFTGERM